MKLAGDLNDFSLPDLIQVHSLGGKTSAIKVTGPSGPGALFLDRGKLVHAELGRLLGEDAFFALLAHPAGYFEVNPQGTAQRTIARSLPDLLLELDQRRAQGRLPRLPPAPTRAPAPAALAPAPVRPGRRWTSWVLVALAAVALLAVVPLRLVLPAAPPEDAAAAPQEPVLEASGLTAAGDQPPRWLSGEAAISPVAGLALAPTIVCRLLVDRDGGVREARIYRSRVELGSFEDEALRVVRGYRFAPAQHQGRPVAVWINWPVEFRPNPVRETEEMP